MVGGIVLAILAVLLLCFGIGAFIIIVQLLDKNDKSYYIELFINFILLLMIILWVIYLLYVSVLNFNMIK